MLISPGTRWRRTDADAFTNGIVVKSMMPTKTRLSGLSGHAMGVPGGGIQIEDPFVILFREKHKEQASCKNTERTQSVSQIMHKDRANIMVLLGLLLHQPRTIQV